jgi:caa(3)-type oxidase subunit IV
MSTPGPHDARSYVLTWLALVALAGASYGLTFVRLGPLSTGAAFAIAGVKGALVLLVFMHFLRTRSSIRLAAAVGVGLFGLLIALATADVTTRDPPPLLPLLPPAQDEKPR